MVRRFYAGRNRFCRLTPPAHSLVQEHPRVLTRSVHQISADFVQRFWITSV
jgi:hypothetical protein